ncbi:MAG: NAD(P)H-hydrate epimerase, partial [Opitutales bacterium]
MSLLPASHPILSCAEAKSWESGLLKDEAAEWAAMQRAGGAIARTLLEDCHEIGGLPGSARLLVLAGKGHNGGDALLAAKALYKTHPRVRVDVLLCFGEDALRPLAKRSLDELRQAGSGRVRLRDFAGLKAELADCDVCLDGVFGFQFRPPMDGATAEILAWVNTHPRIKVRAAVDLPSGLGDENAGTVFRADFTYATGIVKTPLIAPANAAFVGRVRYLDLGFFPVTRVDSNALKRVLLPSLLAPLARLRPAQTDKRTYGHLLVVGSSRNYPGAVLMTVQAALRSGVGLLTAFVPDSLVPEYAARFPEAMWVGVPGTPAGGISAAALPLLREKLPRATALVIGPGLGNEPETLRVVSELVRPANLPLVLDADALRPEVRAAGRDKRVLITPHAGEMARLEGRGGCPQAPLSVGSGSN